MAILSRARSNRQGRPPLRRREHRLVRARGVLRRSPRRFHVRCWQRECWHPRRRGSAVSGPPRCRRGTPAGWQRPGHGDLADEPLQWSRAVPIRAESGAGRSRRGCAPPPPPPPDPAVLAQQAYTELTVPKPEAQRSPPETNSDPDNGGLPYTCVRIADLGVGGQLAAAAAHGGSAWGVGDGDGDPDGVGRLTRATGTRR